MRSSFKGILLKVATTHAELHKISSINLFKLLLKDSGWKIISKEM